MARRLQVNKVSKRRAKTKVRTKKKDPIFVNGQRPRPMYVDYKDVELLKKLTNRQGKIISRRKSGCTAASQHAVTTAIKRARFMALLPYTERVIMADPVYRKSEYVGTSTKSVLRGGRQRRGQGRRRTAEQ